MLKKSTTLITFILLPILLGILIGIYFSDFLNYYFIFMALLIGSSLLYKFVNEIDVKKSGKLLLKLEDKSHKRKQLGFAIFFGIIVFIDLISYQNYDVETIAVIYLLIISLILSIQRIMKKHGIREDGILVAGNLYKWHEILSYHYRNEALVLKVINKHPFLSAPITVRLTIPSGKKDKVDRLLKKHLSNST